MLNLCIQHTCAHQPQRSELSYCVLLCVSSTYSVVIFLFFFFQAEDGIRDHCVTGVQTCALPISSSRIGGFELYAWVLIADLDVMVHDRLPLFERKQVPVAGFDEGIDEEVLTLEIGRASCRERV